MPTEIVNATAKAGYHTCSIMTGSGMKMGFGESFGMAWLGVVIIFFLIVFGRKWLGEELEIMPFNIIGAFIGAYIPYLAIVTFTCSPRFAIVAGVVGAFVGAYFGGTLLGDST